MLTENDCLCNKYHRSVQLYTSIKKIPIFLNCYFSHHGGESFHSLGAQSFLKQIKTDKLNFTNFIRIGKLFFNKDDVL